MLSELDEDNTVSSLNELANVNNDIVNIEDKPDETTILSAAEQKELEVMIFLKLLQETMQSEQTILSKNEACDYENIEQYNQESSLFGTSVELVDVY